MCCIFQNALSKFQLHGNLEAALLNLVVLHSIVLFFFSERLHSIISHCFQNRSCASCTFFEQSIFILGYDFTVSTTVAAMIP